MFTKLAGTQASRIDDVTVISCKRSYPDVEPVQQGVTVDAKRMRREDTVESSSGKSFSDVRTYGVNEDAAKAAERRRVATLSRGIGDLERVESMSRGSKSRHDSNDTDLFGSSKIRSSEPH